MTYLIAHVTYLNNTCGHSDVARKLAQWGHSVQVSDNEQGCKGRVDLSMLFAYCA